MKRCILLLYIFISMSMAAAASSVASSAAQPHRPQVIAHRGGALLGNENTVSCLENGMNLGSDMVEIDVHMTSDGYLVVCHDPTIDRTTDGKGHIEDMTLDSLRSFHIVDSKTGKPTEEVIPTLGEVLALVEGKCGVLLEIKKKPGQYEGIEASVLREIGDFDAHEWVTIQSFNASVVKEVHRLDPTMRVEKLAIVSFFPKRFDYVASINVKFSSRHFIDRCHAAGKEVKVWTVNDPAKMPKGDVDGIITNRPDLFLTL